jgi:hypothetical protein
VGDSAACSAVRSGWGRGSADSAPLLRGFWRWIRRRHSAQLTRCECTARVHPRPHHPDVRRRTRTEPKRARRGEAGVAEGWEWGLRSAPECEQLGAEAMRVRNWIRRWGEVCVICRCVGTAIAPVTTPLWVGRRVRPSGRLWVARAVGRVVQHLVCAIYTQPPSPHMDGERCRGRSDDMLGGWMRNRSGCSI